MNKYQVCFVSLVFWKKGRILMNGQIFEIFRNFGPPDFHILTLLSSTFIRDRKISFKWPSTFRSLSSTYLPTIDFQGSSFMIH